MADLGGLKRRVAIASVHWASTSPAVSASILYRAIKRSKGVEKIFLPSSRQKVKSVGKTGFSRSRSIAVETMQTARIATRPLLGHAASTAPYAATLPAFRPFAPFAVQHRSYATEQQTKQDTMQELQTKQMRLVDKMGRRKQTPAIVSLVSSRVLLLHGDTDTRIANRRARKCPYSVRLLSRDEQNRRS